MRLWRISNYADLDGGGGLVSSGRWHSLGTEIVYLAESPASALLERLVHLEIDPGDIPATYQLIAVEIPDDVDFDTVAEASLPEGWRTAETVTRDIGDDWLLQAPTALLRVPSAIVPHTFNWLLNPRHPDAGRARVSGIAHAPFDPRLFR